MSPERQRIGPIAPFFIVSDVSAAIEFYRQRLGFELRTAIPQGDPFFAIVGRDSVQILLKSVSDTVEPQPNPTRHEWAPWDAFVFVDDPDALAAELESGGETLHVALGDRDDGLRGFEVRDSDGYVLFFGRPAPKQGESLRTTSPGSD